MLAMSVGCALETNPVGLGNGGLDGDGVDPVAGDAGVDEGALGPSSPDAGSPDASTPGKVDPGSSTDAGLVEPVCTPATERSACPGTSCDPVTLTCTTMMLASRNTCETCVTDTNCASLDHRCVWMTHRGESYPDERLGFCLQVAEPTTIAGDYACQPPFNVVLHERESPSGGKLQSYCGIHEKITTCLAVRAFHNEESCPTGRDDECPAGGLCRGIVTQGNKTEYMCTYACEQNAECSSPAANIPCAGFCGG